MRGVPIETKTFGLGVDSIEFCRTFPRLFAVGCYELDKATDTRKGAVCLHLLEDSAENCDAKRMKELQSIEVPGIFGMQWQGTVLATANAGGNVYLFRLNDEANRLDMLCEHATEESNVLSVAWNASDELATSYHSGGLEVFNRAQDGLVSTWKCEQAHSNEAWISHFVATNDKLLLSGADDCLMRGWDIRMEADRPLWTNKKHDAGITCIETNARNANTLIVGSYDETVRLYDLRKPTQECLARVDVGGGVWRIRSRAQDGKLGIAAMRGHYHVLDMTEHELTSFCHYTEIHASEALAYGLDWVPGQDLLIAGSFYDRNVSLWNWQ